MTPRSGRLRNYPTQRRGGRRGRRGDLCGARAPLPTRPDEFQRGTAARNATSSVPSGGPKEYIVPGSSREKPSRHMRRSVRSVPSVQIRIPNVTVSIRARCSSATRHSSVTSASRSSAAAALSSSAWLPAKDLLTRHAAIRFRVRSFGDAECGTTPILRRVTSRISIPEPPSIDLDAVARRFRLPIADVADVSPQAVALVPERWARRFHVLPLSATEHELVIATADPLDVDCERTLGFATGRRVELAIADRDAIGRRIEEVYGGESQESGAEPVVDVQHLAGELEAAPPIALDDGGASVSALVDELLAGGIGGRASDIHIEPEEQGIAVRHRVDGVLGLVRTLPRAVGAALVSRIKILSGLDIADRLRPQDGRARVAINGVAVDLRVSTLPASHDCT